MLGIALMASAAALGGLLVHDGEVAPDADLSSAEPGEGISLKGTPEPFAADGLTRAWRSILPVLANHTYTLEDPESAVVAMLTSPHEAPDGVVLAEGKVSYVAPHPDGSGRLLVVVEVRDWREPILFR
ncbi:MAG: hypothetical protein QOJ26_1283 [Thermoplasmata archaeon]|nr:hypothetical protein [Thermoplasmata archaeon]